MNSSLHAGDIYSSTGDNFIVGFLMKFIDADIRTTISISKQFNYNEIIFFKLSI
jgi:hypothetical protein